MKKRTIIALFIAAIGLIGPKIIGSGANQNINLAVAAINEAPGYQATVVNVESGWFSTSAKVNVGLDPAIFGDMSSNPEVAAFFEDFSITFYVNAQHGPFLSLNGLGVGLLALKAEVDESMLRDKLTYSDDQRLFSLAMDVGLFGSVGYADKVEGFTVIGMDDISFSGWTGKGSMSSSHLDYKGQMGSLAMDLGVAGFEINSMSLVMDVDDSWASMMTDPFYDSTFEFNIGSLIMGSSTDQSGTVTIDNMVMDGVSKQSDDGQLLDVDFNYSVGRITTPQFTAEDLVVKTELLNLEKGFITAMQEVSANPLALEEMASEFESKLLPQLQVSPAFNITEMSGTVGDGSFSGKMLTKVAGVEGIPANLEDLGFWVSKVVVDSKFEVEKAMALFVAEMSLNSQFKNNPALSAQMTDTEIEALAGQQAATMVDTLSQQGMVAVNAEGNLEIIFTMKDGQAVLNGNPMPLPF